MNKSYIIDLSEHNGVVDFKKLSEDHCIEGIYFRIGWSGDAGELHLDKLITSNKVYGAINAGFKVGFYVYVYNKSVESVIKTCIDTYEWLSKNDLLKLHTMPLAFDIEDPCYCDESCININTNMYLKFKNWFATKGINTCVYCNEAFARNFIHVKNENVWLANWNYNTDYYLTKGLNFFAHQFTNKGCFKGINGDVDVSYILPDRIKPLSSFDIDKHIIEVLETQNKTLHEMIWENETLIEKIRNLK